ncbi:SGNH/GDSL hydrolase family protein [Massilia jejuensis]|uniref:SGNH/GDSL hydrolase family protein n=1 Tax=Massilia jejuensis TaxID=648894 RepID=A0ABW0PKM9_9BURK
MQPISSTLSGLARRSALALALALPGLPAGGRHWHSEGWTGSWGTAPAGPAAPARLQTFADQTLRLIVHTSIGGNRVRIRLSNEFGSAPLRIGAARIGVRGAGSGVAPGTDRALTFGGNASVTIAPGAPVLSDPVELNVPALGDLAVSLYLPGTVQASTIHDSGLRTSYVSPPGDFTAAATLPVQRTLTAWPFLTGVDVDSTAPAIVALGDSITGGTRSTVDTDNAWPAWLARRLHAVRDPVPGLDARPGVVNRGIGGSRLLGDSPGPLAGRRILDRFDRDVAATAGVRYMTLMIGIDDIGNSPNAHPVSPSALIAGYRQVIARAHAKGIAVFGATLTPFEGAAYYAPQKEAVRQAVNHWIRSSGEFDGVIDFDLATRDPARPSRLLPAYDSGDHLHPNDLGYQAMGDAVPLALFGSPGAAAAKPLPADPQEHMQ